jgi:HPt (histidine-containing phosphotransfer) domain-containing protein
MTDCSPPSRASATHPPVDGEPVLDAQALANLAQLDPGGVNKLLPRVLTTYRSSTARLLGQLVAARLSFDVGSLQLVVHTLKSSSASIGALTLAALCATAEQALREGRLEGLTSLLDDLETESARVDTAVHQLLSSD